MTGSVGSADLVALLTGRWSIERSLLDRRDGTAGAFTGVATFSPEADGLLWDEEGRLRFGAFEGPATRRLRVRRDPGGWTVLFEDGSLFHPLDLGSGGAAVEHPCGPDVYAGAYDLRDRDRLDVRWDVTGPRKDQEIRSVYRRIV